MPLGQCHYGPTRNPRVQYDSQSHLLGCRSSQEGMPNKLLFPSCERTYLAGSSCISIVQFCPGKSLRDKDYIYPHEYLPGISQQHTAYIHRCLRQLRKCQQDTLPLQSVLHWEHTLPLRYSTSEALLSGSRICQARSLCSLSDLSDFDTCQGHSLCTNLRHHGQVDKCLFHKAHKHQPTPTSLHSSQAGRWCSEMSQLGLDMTP